MFDQLTERLGAIFSRLSGRGKLSQNDVDEVMREVRIALLEADVSLSAVKAFVSRVKEKAIGANVLESLSPAQTILKVVYAELVDLLGPAGGTEGRLQMSDAPPTVIMLVGLQGSGKTTHAAKLALRLKEQGRRSLVAAADVYRPAAIEQLQILGKQLDVAVYARGQSDPVKIATGAVDEARRLGIPVVVLDTAGRLQIDGALMDELERMKRAVAPKEILLVADAMTGQEATAVARGFHDRLGITGVILTKLDGDARGGSALSIYHEIGTPIKFIGVGEKLSALEPFHPDRLASRILGMGDVLTLIERTQSVYSQEQTRQLETKMRRQEFTLDDFLEQMRQVRKLGSMGELVKMIPGLSRALPKDFEIPEKDIARIEAIICSMTRREREDPALLNGSRRKRIAGGSGSQVSDINRLIKQFDQAKHMMKQMGGKRRSLLAR